MRDYPPIHPGEILQEEFVIVHSPDMNNWHDKENDHTVRTCA